MANEITELVIPEGITHISYGAFYNCASLTSVKISNSVKTIGVEAFFGLENVSNVDIGDGVCSIADYAFYGCNNLTKISFGSGIQSIGLYAFQVHGSSKLEKIVVKDIKAWCEMDVSHDQYGSPFVYEFWDPQNYIRLYRDDNHIISDLIIPENVSTINEWVFHGVAALKSVVIPDNVTSIGKSAFMYCPDLERLEIGNEINDISWRAFSNCPKLSNIKFGENVVNIGSEAFSNCYSLTTLNIPKSVMTIEDSAFRGCSGLTFLTIPNSVTDLSSYSFSGCDNLATVVSLIDNPFEISNNTFSKNTFMNATLYIPIGTTETYKSVGGWKDFVFISEEEYIPEPEPAVITVKNCNRIYGEANPVFEYEATGTTLEGTPEISCAATVTSPVGAYQIIASKGNVTNENVSFVTGTLTITKAPLTVSAGNYVMTQGREVPNFEAAYEGFKNDETASVLTQRPTLTCEATSASTAGNYTITISGGEAQNYSYLHRTSQPIKASKWKCLYH